MRYHSLGALFVALAVVVAGGCAQDPYTLGGKPASKPSGTAAPTASPTASPTAAPTSSPLSNLIVNGDFETGSLTPWYTCYAQEQQGAQVDPNPVPSPTAWASPTAGPATPPTASPQPSTDATIQTSTPTGGVYSGTYAALVGYSYLVSGSVFRVVGSSGICQNVAMPASGTPQLTFWVYEGGNDVEYARSDQEADVFAASAGLTSTNFETNSLPVQVLFAENNCYNNLGVHDTTSDEKPCVPVTGSPTGGQWRQKGPFNLSAYNGQTITIFLGTWNNTGGTGTSYFNYAYYDDVVLAP